MLTRKIGAILRFLRRSKVSKTRFSRPKSREWSEMMTRQAYISFIFSQFSHHAASFFAPTVLSSLGGPCYFVSNRDLATFSGVETATWHGFFAPAPHSKALEKLHTLTIGQKMVFPYVRDRMKLSSMEFFSVKIGIGRLVLISRTTFSDTNTPNQRANETQRAF